MFGWHELSKYHPALALFGGVGAFYCLRGIGRLGLTLLRVSVTHPLGPALQVILGVLTVSFVVQLLALAGLATAPLGQILAALMSAAGLLCAWDDIGALREAHPSQRPWGTSLLWWLPTILVAVALLAAAVAPESRADEAAYHALVPSRILQDRAIRVYALPWEATIWPQMAWHFALVPVFATAGSAAARVTSFCIAVLIALTIADIVRAKLQSERLAAMAALAVLAGGYPIAFFVTLGPHAFGYLATFTACLSVTASRAQPPPIARSSAALATAIACAGMIAGKVTMLPLAALVMGLAAWDLMPAGATLGRRMQVLATLIAPSAVFFAPIVTWGWFAAGSPLGAMTAEVFRSPAFDPEAIRIYHGTRLLFANLFSWRFELSYWNAVLLIGVIASLAVDDRTGSRLRYLALLGCQTVVILLFLPREIRHLGGVQYALLVAGLCALVPQLRRFRARDSWIAAGALLALLPWVALDLFISWIYVPLITGFETPVAFLRHYSGLFEDYERLDRILPINARILLGHSATSPTQYAWLARPPIFYASRPVVGQERDLEPGGPSYLLYIGLDQKDPDVAGGRIKLDPDLSPRWRIGKNVYSNPEARFYPSRTPLSSADLALRIDVFELLPNPAAE